MVEPRLAPTQVNPFFSAAIGRNLQFWLDQLQHGDDYELTKLLPHHNEILHAAEFAADLPQYHAILATFIEHYFAFIERSQFHQEWLPISFKLLNSTTLLENSPLYLNHIYRHAFLLRLSGQQQASIDILNTHLHQVQEAVLKGKMLLSIAAGHRFNHQLDNGIQLARKAVVAFQNAKNSRWLASSRTELGAMLTERGDFQLAEANLSAAVEFEKTQQDPTRLIRAIISLGNCYERQNQTSKALETYLSAKPFLDGITRHNEEIILSINIATIYNQIGKNRKARAILLNAEKLLPHFSNAAHYAGLIYLNLSMSAYRLAQFSDVVLFSNKAAEKFTVSNSQLHLARAQINLATGYSKLNRLDDAQVALAKADSILTQAQEKPWVISMRQDASQLTTTLALIET